MLERQVKQGLCVLRSKGVEDNIRRSNGQESSGGKQWVYTDNSLNPSYEKLVRVSELLTLNFGVVDSDSYDVRHFFFQIVGMPLFNFFTSILYSPLHLYHCLVHITAFLNQRRRGISSVNPNPIISSASCRSAEGRVAHGPVPRRVNVPAASKFLGTGKGPKAQTTPSHWRANAGEVLSVTAVACTSARAPKCTCQAVYRVGPKPRRPLHAAKLPVQQGNFFSRAPSSFPFQLNLFFFLSTRQQQATRSCPHSIGKSQISHLYRRTARLALCPPVDSASIRRHLEYDHNLGPAPTPVCPVETHRPTRGESQASRSLLARPRSQPTTLCQPDRLSQHTQLPALV